MEPSPTSCRVDFAGVASCPGWHFEIGCIAFGSCRRNHGGKAVIGTASLSVTLTSCGTTPYDLVMGDRHTARPNRLAPARLQAGRRPIRQTPAGSRSRADGKSSLLGRGAVRASHASALGVDSLCCRCRLSVVVLSVVIPRSRLSNTSGHGAMASVGLRQRERHTVPGLPRLLQIHNEISG
jgi:hypothetical protein